VDIAPLSCSANFVALGIQGDSEISLEKKCGVSLTKLILRK
jgi:hypothetical protein